MEKLSERLHNNIWIKREDRQPVNSFKLRGAYAMISSLSDEQKQAGVIAASRVTMHKVLLYPLNNLA